LPPRQARGAASSISTLAPASAAIKAAHKAALPPPMTSTSGLIKKIAGNEDGGFLEAEIVLGSEKCGLIIAVCASLGLALAGLRRSRQSALLKTTLRIGRPA